LYDRLKITLYVKKKKKKKKTRGFRGTHPGRTEDRKNIHVYKTVVRVLRTRRKKKTKSDQAEKSKKKKKEGTTTENL